ncbi:hypothetical protein EsH8_VI_001118 [Colletotrichum jinshuiense]
MVDELITRGVAWGRQPGPEWKASFSNLEIGNMNMDELVELSGEEVHALQDADWDKQHFLKRLKEEIEKWKENGRW